jgi:hypothetical protein
MSDLVTALRLVISGSPEGAIAAIDSVATSTDKLTASTEKQDAAWAATAKSGHSGMMLLGAGAALTTGLILGTVDAYGKQLEAVVQVQKMTGTSAKWSSDFVVQAQALGVSTDAIGTFLGRMAKNVQGYEQGTTKSTSAIGQAFKDLGISTDSLKGKDAGATIDMIRDKLSKMPAGIERDYVMQSLFGRGAAGNPDLMRFLTATQSQLESVNKAAAKFGLVFSQKDIDNAGKYKEEMLMLKLEFEGVAVSIGKELAPALASAGKIVGQLLWAFNEIPGPIKTIIAFTPGILLMAVGFSKVANAARDLVKAGATVRQALTWIIEKATAHTIATETETVAVGEETVAVEAETVATGSNTMAMLASLGPYALVAAAIAVDIVLIGKAVKAYEEMQQAIQQAAAAAKNAQSTLNAAPNSAFQTNNPNMQSNQSRSQIQSEINRDKYKSPGWEVWKWFGGGGSFTATKPTVIGVGEGGVAEDVTITPHGGSASPSVTEGAQAGGAKGGRGGVVLQFPGAVFYGEPSPAIAQRWAKALAQPLGEMLYNTKHGAGH